MKKTLLTLLFLFSVFSYAQEYCGYDAHQANLESKFPEIKRTREEAEAKLLSMDVKSYLNNIGATSKNNLYAGTIYEIPVVVHVIESSDASNSSLSLTDAQIQTWINNANKMYATNYGNGFPVEGTGNLDGTVIPFKLVLAKRTPQCTATSGIIRYNGSTLVGYDKYGVYDKSNGVTTAQIRTLAPHWSESSYFNIYVVIGFDGDKSTWGLMGWCSYPSNPDSSYDSFMKVTVVTNVDDSTLAHEFGHGMGLEHPFKGSTTPPANNPPIASDCPINNDCTTDNDKVCDTEPTASLIRVNPTPTNAVINPCTGINYNGVQYNIMNYTYTPNKFTPGQRNRAIAMFMQYRASLTTSNGGKDLATNPSPAALTTATCTITSPVNITSSNSRGPILVKLGTINNVSDGRRASNQTFYIDYSNQNCLNTSLYTDLIVGQNYTLQVNITGASQYVKAWIDYNNNGTFEDSELIANSGAVVTYTSGDAVWTAVIIPSIAATLKTPLRFRVKVSQDDSSTNPCADPLRGQIEDYSVRLIDSNSLGTDSTKNISKNEVIFSKENNKLSLISSQNKNFGEYIIYDVNGKVIQKGATKSNEITISKSITSGMYILSYNNGTKTQKFIK